MPTLVLLDNTVLSNFALVGRPDLALAACPGIACTTAEALAEYQAGAEARRLPADSWAKLTVIALDDEENGRAAELPGWLGSGERTCLAIAMGRGGVLATDDLGARRAARSRGVRISGTLGLLVAAVQGGHASLDEANEWLQEMIAAGHHSPPVGKIDDLLA